MGFFGDDSPDPDSEDGAVLELGHVSCLGSTFEWKASAPVHLSLTALHVDRTEDSVTIGPVAMSLPPPRRPLRQVLAEDYRIPAYYRIAYFVDGLVAYLP